MGAAAQCCDQLALDNLNEMLPLSHRGAKKATIQKCAGSKRCEMIQPFVVVTQESCDSLVLGYWNIRGMAQQIRFLLVYLGINFVDQPYNEAEKWEWEEAKDSLGLASPSLPYLIDERPELEERVTLTDTLAILKYITESYDPSLLGISVGDQAYVETLAHRLIELHQEAITPCYSAVIDRNFLSETLLAKMRAIN